MLAVILSLRPYSDRAHIVHTYTRACGRMNYMVYGLGKKKSTGLYAPLSVVEMEVSASGRAMESVREAHLAYIPQRIATDMRRQTVALFIAEVLYRTLRHPMGDEGLFDLIAATVRLLDNTEYILTVFRRNQRHFVILSKALISPLRPLLDPYLTLTQTRQKRKEK